MFNYLLCASAKKLFGSFLKYTNRRIRPLQTLSFKLCKHSLLKRQKRCNCDEDSACPWHCGMKPAEVHLSSLKNGTCAHVFLCIHPENNVNAWSSFFSAQNVVSEDEYLEIPAISRQKAGTYECTAANEVSTDVQATELIVNCKITLLPLLQYYNNALGENGVICIHLNSITA